MLMFPISHDELKENNKNRVLISHRHTEWQEFSYDIVK